jgi:glycosyltransferase involved in cell wall biosynthesis
MRILILNRTAPPHRGATGRLLADLSDALMAAGHEAQSITAPSLPRVLALFWIGLRALCAPRADRVVVMTDPPLLWLWIPLLKLRHGKVFYWCQDVYPDLLTIAGLRLPPMIFAQLQKLKRRALRGVGVIAIGACMAERLLDYHDAPTIIPNWPERDLAPQAMPPMPLRILYAGNAGITQPIESIIAAIQHCAHLPVHFTLMIEGRHGPRFSRALRGQANVTLLRALPWEAAREILAQHHLHLVALRNDCVGLSVPSRAYAALALGRPYVFLGPSDSETARHAAAVLPLDAPDALASWLQQSVLLSAPPSSDTRSLLVECLLSA